MSRFLIVGDCHVEHGQDLGRFVALSRYIANTKPDNIMMLGDFLTLNSLSHWSSKTKITLNGYQYKQECVAGMFAIEQMFSSLIELQTAQRIQKKRTYIPNVYWLEGNHEYWLTKYLEQNPELEGALDIYDDLGLPYLENFVNLKYVPYREEDVCIDNIFFCHTPIAENGQAVSGANAHSKISQMYASHVVYAHTHKLSIHTTASKGNNFIKHIINAGCFFEHTFDYNMGAVHNYWRGVIDLDVNGNSLDIKCITIDKLMRDYM